MPQVSDYTGLITSQYASAPKFMAMVNAVAKCFVNQQESLESFIQKFDLDQAVGEQLDILGLWVGIGRRVNTPLTGVYFSLDIAGVGFNQGIWQGPFDPSTGVTLLDDDTYRLLIRAKIGANHWDGTFASTKAILETIFNGDTHVFLEDNQDMSMLIGISGKIPSTIFLALLSDGYIPLKPEGVRTSTYVVTSDDGGPVFGFDMSGPYVDGFDTGAWGTILAST